MCGSDDLSSFDLSALLELQGAVLDALLLRDPACFTADEVTGWLHAQERVARRQNALDHRLVAALTEQITAGAVPVRNAAEFLVTALRVHPGEAAARVQASVDLTPHRSLTGQRVPPAFPAVAAAELAGDLSARHAAVIRPHHHPTPRRPGG